MKIKSPFEGKLRKRGGCVSIALPQKFNKAMCWEAGEEVEILPVRSNNKEKSEVVGMLVLNKGKNVSWKEFNIRLLEQNYKNNPRKRAIFMRTVLEPLDYVAWRLMRGRELLLQSIKHKKGERSKEKVLELGWEIERKRVGGFLQDKSLKWGYDLIAKSEEGKRALEEFEKKGDAEYYKGMIKSCEDSAEWYEALAKSARDDIQRYKKALKVGKASKSV